MKAPAAKVHSFLDASPRIGGTIWVNQVVIHPEQIGREMAYHPAPDLQQAWFLAGRALVLRELLLQRAQALKLSSQPEIGETLEEALIRDLLEREVGVIPVRDDECEQWYQTHPQSYTTAPLLWVRHLLLPACSDDGLAWRHAQEEAARLLSELKASPERFAELARQYSACPSRGQGGVLGAITLGQLVPELERQLWSLPPGLAPMPLASRYGWHLILIERRIDGRLLPFGDLASRIRSELEQLRLQQAQNRYLHTLVANAQIEGIELASELPVSKADGPSRELCSVAN